MRRLKKWALIGVSVFAFNQFMSCFGYPALMRSCSRPLHRPEYVPQWNPAGPVDPTNPASPANAANPAVVASGSGGGLIRPGQSITIDTPHGNTANVQNFAAQPSGWSRVIPSSSLDACRELTIRRMGTGCPAAPQLDTFSQSIMSAYSSWVGSSPSYAGLTIGNVSANKYWAEPLRDKALTPTQVLVAVTQRACHVLSLYSAPDPASSRQKCRFAVQRAQTMMMECDTFALNEPARSCEDEFRSVLGEIHFINGQVVFGALKRLGSP